MQGKISGKTYLAIADFMELYIVLMTSDINKHNLQKTMISAELLLTLKTDYAQCQSRYRALILYFVSKTFLNIICIQNFPIRSVPVK